MGEYARGGFSLKTSNMNLKSSVLYHFKIYIKRLLLNPFKKSLQFFPVYLSKERNDELACIATTKISLEFLKIVSIWKDVCRKIILQTVGSPSERICHVNLCAILWTTDYTTNLPWKYSFKATSYVVRI